jgi:anti-anti-sigma factor
VEAKGLQELQIDVSYKGKNDDVVVIAARGDIDTITKDRLERALVDQIKKKKYKLVFNLAKVGYVNSSGWGVFLREIKEIREHKGDLVLVNMTPDVNQVFETMELSKIIKSFDTLGEAVKFLT